MNWEVVRRAFACAPRSWDTKCRWCVMASHVRVEGDSRTLCGHACTAMGCWAPLPDQHPEDVDQLDRCTPPATPGWQNTKMSDVPKWVYSVEELKARLPILYAAAELGIPVNEENKATCVFHDDHSPSMHFKVDEPEGDWWVCSPCQTGGDVLSLIRRVEDYDFPTTLVRASEMLDRMPDDWERHPERAPQKFVPDAAWEERLKQCQARTAEHADYGLTAYAYGFVTGEEPRATLRAWDDLLAEWGWGLDDEGRVVIPHRDAAGNLTAVKVRPRRRGWRCYGELGNLYGSWREPAHDDVLLCEGESDCVWAWGQRAGVDCLALPSGARGARNDWVQQLRMRRRVYLGLDADDAGSLATSSWAWALAGTPPTFVVQLRPGADLRSDGRPLQDLLSMARPHTSIRRT